MLDLSKPPSYPSEFFAPAPSRGVKDGRGMLMDDIASAVRSDAASTTADYRSQIDRISDLAIRTNTYFDHTKSENPALDAFLKDWALVRRQAGCG
jgi:hypothetical protein